MMQRPELLLPAGDLETAKLAIDHGADAVYAGLQRFSARAKAKNFTVAELCEAIDYAHARHAKVFCALNILLFNDEIEAAIKDIAALVAHGIDAFIVQDFGLATLLLTYFPETEVHASTQMAVMNVSGAQTMEALGFDRVVLARETSLDMMQAIRESSAIDLEVFVQGALCVCYSGLCYMSSLQGDRSGNRGQCAQPCRRRYAFYDVTAKQPKLIADQYILSPKDMNLLQDLPALLQVPVQSLKVEGRMKQPEYVALMADVYSKHLSHLYQGTTVSCEETARDLRNMAIIFNREGFSTAYLHGVPGRSMMSLNTPKNTGIPLGEVVSLNKTTCAVRLKEPLSTGDGVALYDGALQSLWGGYIDQLQNERGEAGKVFQPGEIVRFKHDLADSVQRESVVYCYKTFDKNLSKNLLKLKRMPEKKIEQKGTLHFYVTAETGAPFALLVLFHKADDLTESYQWTSDFIVEASRNGQSSRHVIEEGLQKLANTGFVAGTIEISGPEQAFVPMSVVTKGRRAAVDYFDKLIHVNEASSAAEETVVPFSADERIEVCLSVLDEIPPQIRIAHEPKISVQVRTRAQADAALAAGADELNVLLFDSRRGDGLTDDEIIALAKQISVIISLPPLMKEVEEERFIAERCAKLLSAGLNDFMVAHLGQVKLLEDLGIEYYACDHTLNVTNDLTAAALSQIGITRQTVSIELDQVRMQNLSAIGNIPLELIVYGRLPAMHTRYCPMGSLVGNREESHACSQPCRQHDYLLERDGKRYPLTCDQFCNVLVLNDKMYDLFPHIDAIAALCFEYWRVCGAFLTAQEVADAVKTLRALRTQQFSESAQKTKLLPLSGQTTQGHFLKGVR